VCAQQGSSFEYINTSNGLPSNYIFRVAEDENGFIWAGSDKGLLKYDGAKWQVFDTDNGLPGNYVNTVISDKHGGLWLGISEHAPVWFNIRTKTAYPIKLPDSINKKKFPQLSSDEAGILNMTFYKDASYTIFKSFYSNPVNARFFETKKQYLSDNELEIQPPLPKKGIILSFNKNNSHAAVIDTGSNGHLFIKLHNKDIYNFAGDYDFINYTKDYIAGYNFVLKKNAAGVTIFTEQKLFERNNKITGALQNGSTLYFSKMGEGLCVIDSTGIVIKYTTSNGLSSNEINHMLKASDGTLYFSTLGGGINIIKNSQRVKFDLSKTPVNAVQYYKGSYYVQAKNTIAVINKNKMDRIINLPKEILCFFIQNDKIYAGSFDGLEQYPLYSNNPPLEKIVRLTAGISSVVPYQNNLVAGTYGSGILVAGQLNKKKLILELPFSNIEKILPLHNGFAATSLENGFFIFDSSFSNITHFTQQNGLLSNAVYHVHEYKDTLWIAGKKGITCITKNKVLKIYSVTEGFKNKKASYIFTDSAGIHWVVADVLYKLANDSLKIADNILLSNTDNVVCVYYNLPKNELAVGTKNGFSILNLNKTTSTEAPTAPLVYQVSINGNFDTLQRSYTLPYNYGKISFYFANGINGLFKNNNLYYKLEGYSDEWVTVSDSLILNASYLPPGKYQLYAKSVDLSGTQSPEVLIGKLEIKRPFWFRNWMLFLYAVGGYLLIYVALQEYNKRKYKKKYEALKLQQELENERQRISKDLHDNMGSYTSALLNNVQQVKNKFGQIEDLDKMKDNADQILSSLRETIWVLNNKEIALQEFSDGFKDYCFKILRNFEGIEFNAVEAIESNLILSAKTAIHLNKILQEALQNTLKHTDTNCITYKIYSAGHLEISIADNGNGFTTGKKSNGNGLENMKWRAVEISMILSIDSVPTGTTITIKDKNTPY
jgi:signal transduction histidine kinase